MRMKLSILLINILLILFSFNNSFLAAQENKTENDVINADKENKESLFQNIQDEINSSEVINKIIKRKNYDEYYNIQKILP